MNFMTGHLIRMEVIMTRRIGASNKKWRLQGLLTQYWNFHINIQEPQAVISLQTCETELFIFLDLNFSLILPPWSLIFRHKFNASVVTIQTCHGIDNTNHRNESSTLSEFILHKSHIILMCLLCLFSRNYVQHI